MARTEFQTPITGEDLISGLENNFEELYNSIVEVDSEPTEGSDNAARSGDLYDLKETVENLKETVEDLNTGVVTLDSTAWAGTETELSLESNVFRDLGDVGVSTTVTVTLESVSDSTLPQYYFKFKYSTGGSFVYTSITAAPDNPDLEDGVYYEASIIRGVLIYKEVA